MNRRTLSIVLGSTLATPALVAALPSDVRLSEVSRSVVRVRCGSATATGFAWTGSDEVKARVVTALHAVSQCAAPTVYYAASNKDLIPAKVVATSTARDLAILEIPGLKLKPLKPSKAVPVTWDEHVVVGHPLGVQKVRATKIAIQFGAETVRGLLPDALAARIINEATGFNLDAKVYSYGDGTIAPGHSGAPVVDQNGDVVAIAVGGLERGAVEIGWAVPVAALDSVSGNALARISNAGTFFSADVYDASITLDKNISCESLNLTRLRTRRFSELVASSDDPLGFQQLAASLTLGGAVLDPGTLSFDLYRDLDSGASVVLPAGSVLTSTSTGCQASVGNDGVRMRVVAAAAPDLPTANAAMVAFETSVISGRMWSVDPAWTYPFPRFAADGSVLLRKGVGIMRFTGPEEYLFETLAYRPGRALVVAVTKDKLSRDFLCGNLGPTSPEPACVAARARHRDYTAAALATHMSGWASGFGVDPT